MSVLAPTIAVESIRDAVAEAVPDIEAGIAKRRHQLSVTNPSGQIKLAADEHVDRVLEERLTALDAVGSYASEERETVVELGDGIHLCVDPLDGSANLESSNAAGTIIGVYDSPLPAAGSELIASMYVLYGAITTMVVASGEGVCEYTVENDGTLRTVDPDLTIPESPMIYGFGGGDDDWSEDFTAYAEDVRTSLKLRYAGALVADVNQVLTYGGVFAYPALESRPAGKLRHHFEASPMAYIVERAGGRSSDGNRSILAAEPDGLHDRIPVHLGNDALIDRLEATV